MKNLSSLLERFAKSLGRNVLDKEIVLHTIEDLTSIRLNEEDVSIKEGVLEITSSPLKNNEIKLKEDKIINELRSHKATFINKIFYK